MNVSAVGYHIKTKISWYSTRQWSSFCTPYVQQSTQLWTLITLNYLLIPITDGKQNKLTDSHIRSFQEFQLISCLNSYCQTIWVRKNTPWSQMYDISQLFISFPESSKTLQSNIWYNFVSPLIYQQWSS